MTRLEKNRLIFLLGCIAAIGPFSIDMYLPSFPSIAKDFGVEQQLVSYTLTGYFIGIALGQLFYGPLLDRYGRKPPLITGLLIYALASWLCSVSPNLYFLVFFRFIQALGSSVGIVASMALIRDQFDITEVAQMFSSILLVMGVAPIIAPTLGGFFLSHFSWYAIFRFLSLIAVSLSVALCFFLKETQGVNKKVSLRFTQIGKNYIRVLSNINFVRFSFSGSLAMAIMFAYISSISFILMDIYNILLSMFGWLFGSNAFGFILGSQVNGYLIRRKDVYRITLYANIVQFLVTIFALILAYMGYLPLYVFCGVIFTVLFLLGFINPNSTALSLKGIEKNIGVASALNGSIRMAIGALVSFLMGKITNGTHLPFLCIISVLSFTSFILLSLRMHKNESYIY